MRGRCVCRKEKWWVWVDVEDMQREAGREKVFSQYRRSLESIDMPPSPDSSVNSTMGSAAWKAKVSCWVTPLRPQL